MKSSKILVLGATGMLGHTLFSELLRRGHDVSASVRRLDDLSDLFSADIVKKIISGVDVFDMESVRKTLHSEQPEVVVNCIGIIKQLPEAKDAVRTITVNALFPHQMAMACAEVGSRLIHMSTDCVFSGERGSYTEQDRPDAYDLYGRSKLLGEVDYPHSLTLRTSIIGHELKGRHSLIEWFLAQQGTVRGYTKAIYSGFPTVEMARIISDFAITHGELSGVYNVSSEAISKYELLRLVAECYNKSINIIPDDAFSCDRSLISDRFRKVTGYTPPSWPMLVREMYRHYLESPSYRNRK